MRAAVLLLLLVLSTTGYAQPVALLQSPALQALQQRLQDDPQQALASFWQHVTRQGTPLRETTADGHVLLTFLWRSNTREEVRLLWPSPGINTRRFQHLPGSDLYYLSLEVKPGLRAAYQIAPGLADLQQAPRDVLRQAVRKAARTDPLNIAGDTPLPGHSLVELPGAPAQPWLQPRPQVARGTLERIEYDSLRLGNQRQLTLYRPPRFQTDHPGYPLLVIFDEQAYRDQVPTPTILDNLIAAGRIPPVVAVLVGNGPGDSRARELPCDSAFGEMLSHELLPWLQQQLPLSDDPAKRLLAGSSYGGLAAACLAYRYPQLFGQVLAQSGSFWWGPEQQPQWLIERLRQSPRLPVRFYLEAGLLEEAGADGILGSSRTLAKVLADKGYAVEYREFNGGHDYAAWRGSLADGLEYLLAAPAAAAP